jgi:galactokinase
MFGGEARVFRAPGRVNLIGEHTDYNEGFVMPVALDVYTWVAISTRSDRRLQIYSEHFHDLATIELDAAWQGPLHSWTDYVHGVVEIFKKTGFDLRGANLYINGEVPIGAGLSSSASIEVALALALLATSGINIPAKELALLCQRAESEFVGTRCGIMDQFTAACSGKGTALRLDCRSFEYEWIPLPSEVSFVVSNTMLRHDLANSEYNRRRAECERAMAILGASLPHARSLRDVTIEELEQNRERLRGELFARCRHVITENRRVLEASTTLQKNDAVRFGQLMTESHESLRDDYKVSCTELDLLVSLASDCPGVYGSRMTGGGFGGCTITLVRSEAVESFRERVSRQYQQATRTTPEIFVVKVGEGAREITE